MRGGPRRIDPEKLAAAYASGRPLAEIARSFDLTESSLKSIASRLRSLGHAIPMRPSGVTRKDIAARRIGRRNSPEAKAKRMETIAARNVPRLSFKHAPNALPWVTRARLMAGR